MRANDLIMKINRKILGGHMKHHLEFQVVFKGDLDYLNSDLLIANLISTTDILREINRELGGPEIKVNIKPFAPGSFIIDFSVIGALVASVLFSAGGISTIKDLLSIFVSLISLKKHLKGKKPTSITAYDDSVIVFNDGGGSVTVNKNVYKLYASNRSINEDIRKAFHALEKNDGVGGLQVNNERNEELVYIPKEDFGEMANPNDLVLESENFKIIESANLVIFKIVFGSGYKWGFYYAGTKISAKMLDREFFKELGKHEFAEGDHLIADLKVIKKYDDFYMIDIIQGYEVIKVRAHKKRDENVPLPL